MLDASYLRRLDRFNQKMEVRIVNKGGNQFKIGPFSTHTEACKFAAEAEKEGFFVPNFLPIFPSHPDSNGPFHVFIIPENGELADRDEGQSDQESIVVPGYFGVL